MEYVQLTPKYC